jgi:serine/threonine-protein kinase HipA
LSPAFDVAYSYNPQGSWPNQHQMSINGKRDNFESSDFFALATVAGIKKKNAALAITEVGQAVGNWHRHAFAAGVPQTTVQKIQKCFRLDIAK